jgi:ribosomal protein S14
MDPMTSPATTPQPAPPVRRLALVPTTGRSDAAVRRFRLARLRLEDREVSRAERFAHLKRSHD